MFWVAKIAVVDIKLNASLKTSQIKVKSKNRSSQLFISRSFLLLSKDVIFAFIAFEFSKDLKTDSRLQIFRAMPWFISIIKIFDFFSDDLKELQEFDR